MEKIYEFTSLNSYIIECFYFVDAWLQILLIQMLGIYKLLIFARNCMLL